ncbi:glycosyltransferase involved in cell wall biosynthesis [Ulvibacter sp. MAR_2010_11]|uniref:glycosyltransferase n=1 Tax=Ulvibacter sp. MAR_2010_11 TaxID=1250229 RepID=UPI000C2BD3DD|nr:glycosyltransferase [Ulvibacter sp. MAR_2010_11]PKA82123.1 glycosyltransferase involved in cell wall biosynthesis [Ulvibacter sp. MAR_2010_11]
MKVLQITSSSKGGAGIAALRLHKALREQGIASAFLSKDLTINFQGEEVEDAFFAYKRPTFGQKLLRKIQGRIAPTPFQKTASVWNSIKGNAIFENVSLPHSVYQLQDHPLLKEADVLNLHWISGIVDYADFFSAIQKPIVWTLHDMNPFSGLFHYKSDGSNNETTISAFDQRIQEYKRKYLRKIQKGAIISPSQWLLEEATQSGFFDHFSIKKCIPNAIDLQTFSVQDASQLRSKHSIPADAFVVLFISHSLEIERKGFRLLLEALTFLSHLPITILTVGKDELKSPVTGIKIISLGKISSPREMASSYAMADVFVLPSKEDNLPNVMLESFAGGTPVISFGIGGMKEHVKKGTTGILAETISGEALAKAIQQYYNSRKEYRSETIREYAEAHFSFKKQAIAYHEVYKKLLS